MGRIVVKIGLGALLVSSVPLGIVAGVWAFFAAAHVTASLALLMFSGALALGVVVGSVSALACAGLIRPERPLRRRLPAGVAGGTLVVTGLLWSALVLEPMDFPYVPMEPPEQTRYWELPTGSDIAYVATLAEGGSDKPAVVWLHGGPGAPDRLWPAPMDRALAEAGFDVYRYHQVGAGLSSRLDDPTEYTVERHVADLEAIRREIGAERLILIGGSWGATLAAHYVAAHPDRVERLLVSGPGAIWQPAFGAAIGEISDGSETDAIAEAVTPRFAIVYYLQRINPRAAHNLASDEEMSGFFQAALSPVIAGDIGRCGEAPATDASDERGGFVPPGFGFYAHMVTAESQNRVQDPRPALRAVDVPVLVVRGECDRIRPEIALEYTEVFGNSDLIVVEGAAHSVAGAPEFSRIATKFILGDDAPGPTRRDRGS